MKEKFSGAIHIDESFTLRRNDSVVITYTLFAAAGDVTIENPALYYGIAGARPIGSTEIRYPPRPTSEKHTCNCTEHAT